MRLTCNRRKTRHRRAAELANLVSPGIKEEIFAWNFLREIYVFATHVKVASIKYKNNVLKENIDDKSIIYVPSHFLCILDPRK